MIKRSFEEQMDSTRSAVARIMGWCNLLALHDTFGIGPGRQAKLAETLMPLEDYFASVIGSVGIDKAFSRMRKQLREIGAPDDFRLPLNRGAKNRKEQQLLIAGNQAAFAAWAIFAIGCNKAFGFGKVRLERLHERVGAWYRQYSAWEIEGAEGGIGQEWAMEQMRMRCERAIHAEVSVVDDNTDYCDEIAKSADEMAKKEAYKFYMRKTADTKAGFPLSVDARMQEAQRIHKQMIGG